MWQKKCLLFINPHQFGHTAGYYYYCQYLEAEFDITYIGFDEGLKKLAIPGIRVIYVPQKKNKLIRIFAFLYKTIKESYNSKYDIIFVYSFYFSFIIGLFSRHAKKIIDIRTDSISINPVKRYLLNKLIKFNTFFFGKAIVLSNDLIDLLKLCRSKCHFLPLGSQKYFEGSHEFDELKLLYVGALNTRNVAQTVEGLYLFLKRNNFKDYISYKIVAFGNLHEEESLKESIEKFELNNYVSFEGRKTHEELTFYFRNCNIGISWIPITPAFNLQPAAKTFEYIMSGLFCMATSTKANRDLINSKNGILFKDTPEDFAKALEAVYKNKDKFISDQIRETVEGYSWQNLVSNNLMPFLKGL